MKKTVLSLSMLIMIVSVTLATGKVIRYKLDNGFTVILDPDNLKNEVFGCVVANVGGKNDPSTSTGLAHYMEHMLFKGTTQLGTIDWEAEKPYLDSIIDMYDQLAATPEPEAKNTIQKKINELSLKANEYVINNELWRTLMEIGGTGINASTGPDATNYYNKFPPDQIEKWLEIYSHRFINPVFRGFQAELEVVYEEKNMYSDQFISNLLDEFQRNFFKNHPYGQQTILGSVEHLKNPQLSKMIEFYNTWYVANNMALILVGNFDPEHVKPLIEEKFSRLPGNELPPRLNVVEEPFNGREQITVKYSPVSLGILGFRALPKMHPDKIKLDIANGVLSNTSSSGLLDRLNIENKVMMAQIIELPYNDHGASLVIFVPKILRQTLKSAENLVLWQINLLKTGQFNDELLETIKLEKYRDFQLSFEDYKNRGMLYSQAFVSGKDIDELMNYPEQIKSVTKDDVIEIARKYYGENYLAFYSKRGKPDKEKIQKPGFKPIVINRESQSDYVQQYQQIPSMESEYIPVDFDNDIITLQINPLSTLYVSKNRINDIFSLSIRYKTGRIHNPALKHLAVAMNYAGTINLTPLQIKTEMGKLGCTYYIYCDDNYFVISLSGPEENLGKALKLADDLMMNATFSESAVSKIWEEEKLERKLEKAEPRSVADALLDYVRFGNNSGYLTRLTERQIKNLDKDALVKHLTDLRQYEMDFHYSGQTEVKDLLAYLESSYRIPEQLKPGSLHLRDLQQYPENTIFLLNSKKSLQSNIYFYIKGEPYTIEDTAPIRAFNTYFGGSFSGIIVQEIREFRSMSYAVSGLYYMPVLDGHDSQFIGYMGTQADKTAEALDIYINLLTELPQKPERVDMVRNYLLNSGATERPDFRQLSLRIQEWKQRGFDQDPYLLLAPQYQQLEFETILDLHARHLKDKPVVIVIVGDKKRLDMNEIAKFGKVVEISEKEIFTK